jgi:hypothetical protein
MNETKEMHECCPVFDPVPWNNKTHDWTDKPFIRDYLQLFFHMPFPPMMAKVIGRMWKKAEEAGAAPEMKDFLLLAYDPSPWKSELYLSVSKEVPGAENVKLTGTFISKVFDGPFNHVPKFIKELDSYLADQGKKAKKYYFYYTTCPKCAKKYGHNYIVAFAEV